MTTANVAIKEGTADKRAATYSISEDAQTKQIQRIALNKSDGTEIAPFVAGTAGTPSANVMTVQGAASMTPVQEEGAVAHDAADSGNPVKIGYKAAAGMSGATLVAAGDRGNAVGDLGGATYVRPHCGLEDIVAGAASNTDGTSTEVIATAGAGVKQYLTKCSLSNTHASTGVMVALKSGTTSKWRCYVPPGGRELNFDPPLPPNAANEAWNFDPDSAVTTIECAMLGFKSKI